LLSKTTEFLGHALEQTSLIALAGGEEHSKLDNPQLQSPNAEHNHQNGRSKFARGCCRPVFLASALARAREASRRALCSVSDAVGLPPI